MKRHIPGGPPADEATRVRLGASADTAPDLLAVLAADPELTVRAAVALNPAAPAGADRLLCGDGDERIRSMLARRLATLLPGQQLPPHAPPVLAGLVEDQSIRVRAAITDVVKEMPQAPRKLILRLAQDSAVPVSYPIIRLSPVLTTEDLLALLGSPPNSSVASAVAARAGLNETLSQAVTATADEAAIGVLLANHTAAIRDSTLDKLVAGAASRTEWQEMLRRRPRLSPAATIALSEFLNGRKPVRMPTVDEARWEAQALADRDQLNEAALLGALERGELRMATAMLAVAADVPVSVVERAATLRSAKALVSLVWRAGFSMQVAGPVQTLLAGTPAAAVLRPGPGGTFPLAKEEMCWQISLLKGMVRK